MEKSIFEILTENAINERLGDVLLYDAGYQRTQRKFDKLLDEFEATGLSKEQRLAVDRLISAQNEIGSCYGRITYHQGIIDCALLLVEIGLIKDGKREAWHEQ